MHHQQGEQLILTNMADREEIQKLKLEFASLSREEERLQKRREADELRRHVAEKRKSVFCVQKEIIPQLSSNTPPPPLSRAMVYYRYSGSG